MAITLDGTTGISTPGETNTGNLSVTGTTTLTTVLPVTSGGTGASSLSGITVGTTTNLAGGSAGTIPYQSTVGTTAMLATGTSGQVLTSAGALAAPTWNTLSVNGGATATNPMSANITLTSSSNKVQVLTPDAQSRRITLPDATTISAAGGPVFILQNTVPWYPVAVMDSAGTNIGWVVADYQSQVYLTSTASATGNWIIKTGNPSADAGVYPYDAQYAMSNNNSYYGRSYTCALSTSTMVGTTGSGNQIAVGGFVTTPTKSYTQTDVAYAANYTSLATAGNYAIVAVSSTLCMTFFNDTTNSRLMVFAVSINASTGAQTKGTELDLGASNNTPFFSAMAIDTSRVLVTYRNSSNNYVARIISVAGTTCTAGSASSTLVAAGSNNFQVAVLSTTLAHFASNSTIWDLTLSGTSVTVNSSVAIGATGYGIIPNSSTSSIIFYDNGSSQLQAKVVTSSGGTPTLGTASASFFTIADNISVSTVKAGVALVMRSVSYAFPGIAPSFALVKVSSGIPVLMSTGTFPAATLAAQEFLSFSSGLGFSPITTGGTSSSFNYTFQKIAVVGGI